MLIGTEDLFDAETMLAEDNFIKEINETCKNQENQSHFKEYENRIYFDDKGYEWNWHEFS